MFRYAIATGRAVRDPAGDLRGALPPAKGQRGVIGLAQLLVTVVPGNYFRLHSLEDLYFLQLG